MRPTYIVDEDSFARTVNLGTTVETKVLEFKERYAPTDSHLYELRKDVAACLIATSLSLPSAVRASRFALARSVR